MNNINYTCMVSTNRGPVAKIDGQWAAVNETQGQVTEIRFVLDKVQREDLDLLNEGEVRKTWVNA